MHKTPDPLRHEIGTLQVRRRFLESRLLQPQTLLAKILAGLAAGPDTSDFDTEIARRAARRRIEDFRVTVELETRRRVGYLPENMVLYPDLSVTALLDFAARVRGLDAKTSRDRREYAIKMCGLEEVRRKLIGKLSKGYRQRVGIAQAILSDPEVLILDEPTVGLDPRQVVEIRELIRSLARQLADRGPQAARIRTAVRRTISGEPPKKGGTDLVS